MVGWDATEKGSEKRCRPKGYDSAKPKAIVLAALELFTRYGYRKTSIDDIAQSAQVAKRTVSFTSRTKRRSFLRFLNMSAIRCDSGALPPSARVARRWIG